MSTWDEMMDDYCSGKSNTVNTWDFGPYCEAATPEESDSKKEEIIETVETPVEPVKEEQTVTFEKPAYAEPMKVEVPAKAETETTVKAVKIKKADKPAVDVMPKSAEVKAAEIKADAKTDNDLLKCDAAINEGTSNKAAVKAKTNSEIDSRINELLTGVKNSKVATKAAGPKVNTVSKKPAAKK